MLGRIYIIRNKINDKVYIGQTIQTLNRRYIEHKRNGKSKRNKNRYFYNAIAKYGMDNFYIELLEDNIPMDQLDEKEIYYINKYDSINKGYNISPGGERGYTIDLPIKEIKELYSQGNTLKEIGEIYNCDKSVISNRLKSIGLEIRDWNSIQRVDITKEELEELYINQLLTTPEIAKIYNTSHQTILKRLNKYNIPTRKAINRKYLNLD